MSLPAPNREADTRVSPVRGGIGEGLWRCRIVFILLLFAAYLGSVAFSPTAQWDFRALYLIAKAHQLGANPYDSAAVSAAVGVSVPLPFVYLPHAIYVFRPFTWVSLPVACVIYVALKTAALALIVSLWWRMFRVGKHPGLFLLFLPFAFGAAVLGDLRSGNISIFEQTCIWLGFYAACRGRLALFGVAILGAASFKLVPILLMGYLLTTGRRRDIALLMGFGVLFGLGLALNYVLWPELTSSFLQNARGLKSERGIGNPSTWAFLQDAATWLQVHLHVGLPKLIPLLIYAGLGLGVVAVSYGALRRTWSDEAPSAVLWRICLTCLLFAVVVPRFKNYSYILLIGPAFFVLMSGRLPSSLVLGCALVMTSTQMNFIEFGKVLGPFYHAYMEYYPLLMAWLVWGLCCYSILHARPVARTAASPGAA